LNPVSELTITGPNGSTSFNAILIPDNSPVGGPFYQNSENLGFLLLSAAIGGFDPNLVGTYKFDLALFSGDSRTSVADVNIVVNTAAVPGPVVGAGLPGLMMALGGLLAWRRRKAQAA
jgi:LPXTG-motif cell wall-anchored protein